MPELLLHRNGDMLETHFGDYSATAPWSDIALLKLTQENAYTYGRDLFELVTQHEQLRNALTNLPRNTRIVLLAEQAEVAAIHWEYMRLSDGTLLAARHNLVRGIPESQRRERVTPVAPLNIVAIPVSPLNESRVLNTEGEWKKLTELVEKHGKALTLTRVRPPTRGAMMGAIGNEGTTIVQFMGHSNVGVLLFEDEFGNAKAVSERDFVNALDGQPYLVIMNSCYSAVSSGLTFNGMMLRDVDSHLGNIARAVVLDGIPYALGMQFALYDYIALKMTDYFYEFLLKSSTVEEAMRRTRARLEDTQFPFEAQGNEPLPTSHWLAGVPVLYTNQREAPLALPLSSGQVTLHPDLKQLSQKGIYNLDRLPQPDHFTGRGKEIHKALELFSYFEGGFIMLHGLGGIGKTALARTIAGRVSYRYDDRVFAYSFETFTRSEGTDKEVVNEQFAGTFYSTLASYYGLDAKDYLTVTDLQRAILNQRRHTRSLLILDNMETLISKQREDDAQANELAAFIKRLKEDKNVVLLTSRYMPPADWGDVREIRVKDLDDFDGARLFITSIAEDRRAVVTGEDCLELSRHVGGHPLSIRLLAGSFSDDNADTLATFLKNIEQEIPKATQKTASSSEDAQRQKSIDACMHYSIRRLTDEQKKVLYTVGIFLAPFRPEWAENVLDDKEQTRKFLQDLERLGLLESSRKDFEEGYILLYEMHPMLRQHIKVEIEQLDKDVRERYGLVYQNLARQAWEPTGGYDSSNAMRFLLIQSLPDCEAALIEEALSPAARSSLAYLLAKPYTRRGQIQKALSLYEQSLKAKQALGDVREVAATQHAMADVLVQQGKVSEAMSLYEQSLKVYQELSDIRSVAVTKTNYGYILWQQGDYNRALQMVWEAYRSLSETDFSVDIRTIQGFITSFKQNFPGDEQQFDILWQQATSTPQPDWLRDVQGNSSSNASGELDEATQTILEAIAAFVNAPDWDATQHVLKAKQAILFQPEVEVIFEQNIEQYKNDGQQQAVKMLTMHLEILRACKADGIEETFERVKAMQAGGDEEDDGDDESDTGELSEQQAAVRAFLASLPFDAELIPRSIEALSGGPQVRMAHMQYLTSLVANTDNEQLKALVNAIQLAMFGGDMAQLGEGLSDVYKVSWDIIVANAET